MAFGKRFVGRRGWCIRVWVAKGPDWLTLEHTWTHLAPGPVKGQITLEHNSVGACIAGQLTFDGFCGWEPRSRLVEVYYGPEPILSNRLGMGIVGIVRGQKTAGGGRTATVPLLGLHSRDENGLSELGFSHIANFVSAEIYVLGSYYGTNNTPRRFGLTNDAAIKELFGDRVDSSWGVRPDGLRVAGYAGASGFIYAPSKDEHGNDTWELSLDALVLDGDAINITYEDSGYEEPSFITEAQWRMSERYSPRTIRRGDNGLVPRRGSSAETGTGELMPTTSNIQSAPAGQSGQMVGFTTGVDLVSLMNGSIRNPTAFNPMYETVGVALEVTVTAEFPEDEKDDFEVEGAGIVRQPALQAVYLEWAEWLAGEAVAPTVRERTTDLPKLNLDDPDPEHWQKVATSTPIKNADGLVIGLNETVIKPTISVEAKPEPFISEETVIEEGETIRNIYHQYATLTPERPRFVWRFEAPPALLQIVDGAAPTVQYEAEVEETTYQNGVPVTQKIKKTLTAAAYKWCVGVAATASRKTTNITMTVTPVMHAHNAVREPPMPDFPGYNLPFCSPPTFTGKIDGELVYGPVIIGNLRSAAGGVYSQGLTNTRMIIATDTMHTEFQTAAAQRTSNGTAQNMTNPQSFGSLFGSTP